MLTQYSDVNILDVELKNVISVELKPNISRHVELALIMKS
jgi:hypothetical protein